VNVHLATKSLKIEGFTGRHSETEYTAASAGPVGVTTGDASTPPLRFGRSITAKLEVALEAD
jgi:hypothetical protein